MGNCSNITNTQTVSLTSGTITSGFCHTSLQATYEEFIARTSASLSGNVAAFTAGDDTPSSSDQNKLWWKQDASNCNTPLGWFYYNTSNSTWENAHPVKDDEVTTDKILDNNVTLAKLDDGTQGDILYYGTSGAPTRLTAGTSGQYLKTQGADADPTWGTIETPEQAIKAIVVANDDTHYGASTHTDGSETLETDASVTLDASTDYIFDCSVNLIENSGHAAGTLDGEFLYSVDEGSNWTKFADVKQFEYLSGNCRSVDITFAKGFTTNSSGGSYDFKFDCDPDQDQTDIWWVHDFSIRILKGPTLVGGDTHEQAE